MAMPMPAHHLLGQKSWNVHFGVKSPRTKVKNHIGHDRKIAGPFSNTCGNWSGVHLVCFKHALLSKSGCFRHVWPLESFFTGSCCGIQRCCQGQQERTCTGKNCDFGHAKELAFDDEKISKQRSKTHHVPSPQERNPPLNAKENSTAI